MDSAQASNSSGLSDLLKIGIPSLIGALSAIGAYRIGKREKRDAIELKRQYELGDQISVLFLRIHETYTKLTKKFKADFGHFDLERAAHVYGSSPLHKGDIPALERLNDDREQLRDLIKAGRLYLNLDLLNRIEKYVELGDFVYSTDGGIMHNSYMEDFVKNLCDPAIMEKRNNWHTWVEAGVTPSTRPDACQ